MSLSPEISVDALSEHLKRPDKPLVLDVREPWETSAAPFPGAALIPMGDIPARAHQELDPDAHIVVVCHHGARSLNVTMWLRQQGFEQVQSLSGGIDHWAAVIDPAIPRY